MGELGAVWITKYMHDWIVSSDHASLGVIAVVGCCLVTWIAQSLFTCRHLLLMCPSNSPYAKMSYTHGVHKKVRHMFFFDCTLKINKFPSNLTALAINAQWLK